MAPGELELPEQLLRQAAVVEQRFIPGERQVAVAAPQARHLLFRHYRAAATRAVAGCAALLAAQHATAAHTQRNDAVADRELAAATAARLGKQYVQDRARPCVLMRSYSSVLCANLALPAGQQLQGGERRGGIQVQRGDLPADQFMGREQGSLAIRRSGRRAARAAAGGCAGRGGGQLLKQLTGTRHDSVGHAGESGNVYPGMTGRRRPVPPASGTLPHGHRPAPASSSWRRAGWRISVSSRRWVANSVWARTTSSRCSHTAHAMARPSSVLVPRPISSRMMKLRSVAARQDPCGLVHFHQECRLTTRKVVAGTNPAEDPVHRTDTRLPGGYEGAQLSEQHDQRGLPQVRRFAGHVGPGQQYEPGSARLEV